MKKNPPLVILGNPVPPALAKGFQEMRKRNPISFGRFMADMAGGAAFGVGAAVADRHLVPSLLGKKRKKNVGNPWAKTGLWYPKKGKTGKYYMKLMWLLREWEGIPGKKAAKARRQIKREIKQLREKEQKAGRNPKKKFVAKRFGKRRRRGVPKELGLGWHERKMAPASAFDPGSFRYKRVPKKGKLKAYVLLGCPKGGWHRADQWCEVGTRAHVILTPKKKVARRLRRVANPNLPPVPPHMMNDPRFRKELAVFRKRHGKGPVEIFRVRVPKGHPKYMTAYGQAPATLYDAHKKSPKGKRIHHFGKKGKKRPWLVSSNEKGRKFLSYVGGNFRAEPDWIYD